jgi:hypothetical protein
MSTNRTHPLVRIPVIGTARDGNRVLTHLAGQAPLSGEHTKRTTRTGSALRRVRAHFFITPREADQ